MRIHTQLVNFFFQTKYVRNNIVKEQQAKRKCHHIVYPTHTHFYRDHFFNIYPYLFLIYLFYSIWFSSHFQTCVFVNYFSIFKWNLFYILSSFKWIANKKTTEEVYKSNAKQMKKKKIVVIVLIQKWNENMNMANIVVIKNVVLKSYRPNCADWNDTIFVSLSQISNEIDGFFSLFSILFLIWYRVGFF